MSWLRLVLSGVVLLAMPVSAATSSEPASTVSIRIHDYARVDGKQIQRAQQQVADMYGRIGVLIDWRAPVRPRDIKPGLAEMLRNHDSSITVVLISGEMAGRVRVPANVAGYAATDGQAIGRIAFIVADRTERIAWRGQVDHPQVLAGVIAHELAHLLMPGRAHSRAGIMRPVWAPAEFKDARHRLFSDEEAGSIRRSVAGIAGVAIAKVAD